MGEIIVVVVLAGGPPATVELGLGGIGKAVPVNDPPVTVGLLVELDLVEVFNG